jgi:curved DNA-binding protein CbpA
MAQDHYKVLGIERSASRAEIKKAWLALAAKYHPDKNDGKTLPEYEAGRLAFDVLHNPLTRLTYDETGEDTPRPISTEEYLNSLIGHVIQQYSTGDMEFNLVGTVRKTVKSDQREASNLYLDTRAQLKKRNKRLKRAREKVRKASGIGSNVFLDTIDAQLADVERRLLALEHARKLDIEKYTNALQWLDDYEDEQTQGEAQPAGFFDFVGN